MNRRWFHFAAAAIVGGLLLALVGYAYARDTRDGVRIESCTREYGRAVAVVRVHNGTDVPAMFVVRVRLNDSVELLQAPVDAGGTVHERMVGWVDIDGDAVCTVHSVERN